MKGIPSFITDWSVGRIPSPSSVSLSLISASCLLLVLTSVTGDKTSRLSCPAKTNRSTSFNVSSLTTQLNMNVAFLINIGNKGHGRFYGGAFFLAVQKLKEMAAEQNINVNFTWTFRDTKNKESLALKEMVDLYCNHTVSAFIGPDVFCKSAGLLATGFKIPYITYNCEENHNETGELLIVNTEISFMYVSRYIVSVMRHFQWKHCWVVTGETNKWQNIAKQLSTFPKDISIIGVTQYIVNDEFATIYVETNRYKKIIQDTRHQTRVYVFLGTYESLLLFVRALADLDVNSKGEYAVVATDESSQTDSTFYFTKIEKKTVDSMTEEDKRTKMRALRNVVVIKPLRLDNNSKEFEDAVFNRSLLPPINMTKPPKNLKRPDVPDGAYYLYDAAMIYGRAVVSVLQTGGDPNNATQIIDHLRCRKHVSKHGHEIWIHENGETEDTYKVESLFFDTDAPLAAPLIMEVGHFSSEEGKEPEYIAKRPIQWISGEAPISKPDCGFDGKLCPSREIAAWKLATICVGVVIFVLFVVVIFILGIRHYMYEQKLERLAWKIEKEDIQILNSGQFGEMTTPSRPRKKDSYSGNQLRSFLMVLDSDPEIISDESCGSDDIPLGVYKGTNVAVRKLTRKNLELTRSVKKQLQLRKELTHENINRFIGACIDLPDVYMVTQYCPRKSLQDILRNEDSPLDEMFSTSLVQDLIRGMSFIHDSEIGCHGNLKSSNCLVDSRWTLKVSDFGLSALGPPDARMFDDEESSRGLLWTAPELLRIRRRSSNTNNPSHSLSFHSVSQHSSSNNNNNNNSYSKAFISGSQKGDVYSFAIVLYELYGKCGPWGKTELTNEQIIDCLLSETTPVLRPDTSGLTCDLIIVKMIQACWEDDPDLRPDFKYGIRSRFKPIQQGFLKSNIFDNMLVMMEKYATNLETVVAERTEQLRLEKRMTDNLLLRMLPRSVAEKLKLGQRVEAEQFEQVSLYFSDIVGFTELSAESTPMEVVDLLNDLYTCFDSIIEEFDVYKVETIGDAYMVVSGLPIRNGNRHAGEIASMSLLLLEAIRKKQFRIRGSPNNLLKIRIGIHSGPCCAGVVGLKMPRYCLFGDTVNTASRLESTGEALKIHCSAECKQILDKLGGYTLEERGYIEMKGKGSLLTYFLKSEDQHERYKRIYTYKRMGSDVRCVSSSNLDYAGKIYSISGKSLAYNSLQNGSKNSAPWKDSPTHNLNSSLGTTIDTDCSEDTSHLQQQQHSHQCTVPSHEFISSTLPRTCHPKFNNPQMSPIAEDPSFGDRTLEKTMSFPNSSLHESNTSENDALLGGVPTLHSCTHARNAPCRRALSNRSLLRSPRTGGMESFDEDTCSNDVEEHEDTICDLVNPETVL